MERYVAFLAGMNVGGHRVTNDALRALFEELDLDDVGTFLASGNVVFSAPPAEPQTLAEQIAGHLGSALGYSVPAFVRTAPQVRAIAAYQPFPEEAIAASRGKLQVSLLAAAPDADARRAVLALADERDRLAIRATELYWLPSGGILESPLDLRRVSAALGSMTMRTANTVRRLAAKYLPDPVPDQAPADPGAAGHALRAVPPQDPHT